MKKAVITDYAFDQVDIEKEILEPQGYALEAQKSGKDPVALAALVKDADAVITQFAPVTADVIGAMQKCRVIVRYGIGVDNVDLKAAAAKGIPVCNVPDYCIDEVADHTLALILAATRQIVPCNNVIKSGQWKLPVPLTALHGLKYMTVGLVAFGRIGREVAARLKPFKCRILVFDPLLPAAAVTEAGCVPVTLDELLAQSDLVSLHCPSTEKTKYIINAQSIAKMKKGAILVNASRGTLVDTPAMVAALQSGQLSAAAMDVTDPEPINPDNPLLKLDNVVITPHVASATPQAVKKLRIDAAGIAANALRGEKLPNIVNGVAVRYQKDRETDMTITSKERISRILKHQPVDRIGLFEVFWRETAVKWSAEGHFEKPEMISNHFGLDLRRTGGEITPGNYRLINLIGNVDAKDELVEETETTRLVRDGNGALLRLIKNSAGGPEHVGFRVEDRQGWEEHILPYLLDEKTYEKRINFDAYRETRQKCGRDARFMTCGVLGAFDTMSPMCGHENLLIGMAADPDWVRRMADLYSTLYVRLLETLFQREGLPDGLWVWDDLGYKHTPFMSTAMYRELIMPAHKKLFDFAHSHNLPVVLHCDGFVEALIPSLIEAGINCLQPIEIKAGMDLLRIKKNYGEKIALIGGMDERVLESNDLAAVRRELEAKVPAAMAGSGYVLQVDHSVSNLVNYETYKFFVETGLKIGTY